MHYCTMRFNFFFEKSITKENFYVSVVKFGFNWKIPSATSRFQLHPLCTSTNPLSKCSQSLNSHCRITSILHLKFFAQLVPKYLLVSTPTPSINSSLISLHWISKHFLKYSRTILLKLHRWLHLTPPNNPSIASQDATICLLSFPLISCLLLLVTSGTVSSQFHQATDPS